MLGWHLRVSLTFVQSLMVFPLRHWQPLSNCFASHRFVQGADEYWPPEIEEIIILGVIK